MEWCITDKRRNFVPKPSELSEFLVLMAKDGCMSTWLAALHASEALLAEIKGSLSIDNQEVGLEATIL